MIRSLPEDYAYKIIKSNERSFVFRIKNVSDKETALAWLSAYENKSKYTWRTNRTYPRAGKNFIFNADYRCQHKTDQRFRSQKNRAFNRISKHTGCEATLKIRVKRFIERSKSKCLDPDAKEYPCMIAINNQHNHSPLVAGVFRFPKKLRKRFSIQLDSEPSVCENISYDSERDVYRVPGENGKRWEVDLNLFFCTCLVGTGNKLCKHIYAVIIKYSIEDPEYESRAIGKNLENEELSHDLSFNSLTSANNSGGTTIPRKSPVPQEVVFETAYSEIVNSDTFDETYSETAHSDPFEETYSETEHLDSFQETHTETIDLDDVDVDYDVTKLKLTSFYHSLVLNMDKNPKVFVPAVKKMMENAEKFIKDENSMLSALNNFSIPFNLQSTMNIEPKKSGVKPKTTGKRKTTLTSKKRLLVNTAMDYLRELQY